MPPIQLFPLNHKSILTNDAPVNTFRKKEADVTEISYIRSKCLRGQEPKPIPIENETSPLYAELDAFITMIKQRGGNEGYLSVSLATCRVLDELAKQNKLTFRQTHWNMVVHRDD